MNIRQIILCSILAALEFIAFTSFSFFLYMEVITLMIVIVALSCSQEEAWTIVGPT